MEHAGRVYFHARSRKTASNRRFQGKKEPLGASRKSQQQTIEDGLAALYCSIADRGPDVERARRANGALKRAKIGPIACADGLLAADRRGGERYKPLLKAFERASYRGKERPYTPDINRTF